MAGFIWIHRGAAAQLAVESIRKVEVLNIPSWAWGVADEVENFPAFIIVDDKGNDFFRQL